MSEGGQGPEIPIPQNQSEDVSSPEKDRNPPATEASNNWLKNKFEQIRTSPKTKLAATGALILGAVALKDVFGPSAVEQTWAAGDYAEAVIRGLAGAATVISSASLITYKLGPRQK